MPEAPPTISAEAPSRSNSYSGTAKWMVWTTRWSSLRPALPHWAHPCYFVSNAAKQGARAEPTAAAHGHKGILALASLKFMYRFRYEGSSSRAEGVAECDGAAVGIYPIHIRLHFPLPGEDHRGERLVNLHDVDVVDGKSVV